MCANEGFRQLTEKEKETLRMLVRGHDAKSIARRLGLSVHTINERLRAARRKLEVSSSREAARLLLEAECGNAIQLAGAQDTDFLGDNEIGEDAHGAAGKEESAPSGSPGSGAGLVRRRPRTIVGVALMTFALSVLALAAITQSGSPSSPVEEVSREPVDTQVVDIARGWLARLDQGKWEETYQATTASFRNLNTLQVWTEASERARAPLGAVVSRTFLRQENLPAPPAGYEVVKFRTSFANKADAVETVSFARESGSWRVAGVTIE